MEQKTYAVMMDNQKMYFVDGETPKDIFRKIDGLRLQGMRWLEVYRYKDNGKELVTTAAFVNIDHIVSIEEC